MTQEILEKALALQKEIEKLKTLIKALNSKTEDENVLFPDRIITPIINIEYCIPTPYDNRFKNLQLDREFIKLLIPFLTEKIQSKLEIVEKELLEL